MAGFSMNAKFKPAVVTVGDELMFGERSNTNQVWMLKILWQRGIPANIALSLPDSVSEIAGWIKRLKDTGHDLILVSGGIGGTHDDLTREGIAEGLGIPLAEHKTCLHLIHKRAEKMGFEVTPQIARMAMLPEGCDLIANPIGSPGFSIAGVYAFPGFPTMLQPMATSVLDKLCPPSDETWLTKEITLPVSEGAISQAVESFSKQEADAHVGIYPSTENYRREVTLKFRGPGADEDLAARFDELVATIKDVLDLD